MPEEKKNKWALRLWELLNGNKTAIGMVLVLISQGMKVFLPTILTPDQLTFIETTGMIIGGVGLTHKGIKAEIVQKAIDKNTKK